MASLLSCPAARGMASLLRLDNVDRTDAPGGKHGSGPGLAASHYLQCSSSAGTRDVPFSELVAEGTKFVLYSVEKPTDQPQPFLVLLELDDVRRAEVFTESAFIDRGVRALVSEGSRVAVTTVETAEDYLADKQMDDICLSFVWNTGRCGSTLMNKALTGMGVASYSEPHWLDQLMRSQDWSDPADRQRSLALCVRLEVALARVQNALPGWKTTERFSFNPKAGGVNVAESATAAFPNARHVFMYRACHKVVESFGGLLLSDLGWMKRTLLTVLWATLGTSALKNPASAEFVKKRAPELSGLSSLLACMLATMWMQGVSEWIKVTRRRRAEIGPEDPLACARVIRMDEFVAKDVSKRNAVVLEALRWMYACASDADEHAIAPALAAFNVNSQKGSKMGSGKREKFLTANDEEVIKKCVLEVFSGIDGGSDAIEVQNGGANIVLGGSLGC